MQETLPIQSPRADKEWLDSWLNLIRDHAPPFLISDPEADITGLELLEGHVKNLRTEDEYVFELAEDLPPIHKDCKLSVIIPVAAHQESEFIRDALNNYIGQTGLMPNEFEVVVFLNSPVSVDTKQTEPCKAEIDQFIDMYPTFPLRIIETHTDNYMNFGTILDIAFDLLTIRSYNSGKDIIVVKNDADTEFLPPEYIQSIIRQFDIANSSGHSLPYPDMVQGPANYGRGTVAALPILGVKKSLYRLGSDLGYKYAPAIRSLEGPNFALRTSAYVASGGFDMGESVYCEYYAGLAITLSRGEGLYCTGSLRNVGSLAVETSARREIPLLLDNAVGSNPWENAEKTFLNDPIRTKVNVTDFPVGTGKVTKPRVQEIVNEVAEMLDVVFCFTGSKVLGELALELADIGVTVKLNRKKGLKVTSIDKLMDLIRN